MSESARSYRPMRPMMAGEKVSKETAEYRKGSAFERCGLCCYMHGQTCDVVRGYIAPYQVCKYFQPKMGEKGKRYAE
jgi:hypothetical protein